MCNKRVFIIWCMAMTTPPDQQLVRSKARAMLASSLTCDESMVNKLEKLVFNWAYTHCTTFRHALFWENPHFRHVYTSKLVNVSQLLKHDSEIRKDVESKCVSLRALVFEKPWVLKPKLWEAAFDASARRQMKREQLTESSFDGLLQCSKCKSRKVSYCTMQTRSADEGATVFAYCHECSARWKQYN